MRKNSSQTSKGATAVSASAPQQVAVPTPQKADAPSRGAPAPEVKAPIAPAPAGAVLTVPAPLPREREGTAGRGRPAEPGSPVAEVGAPGARPADEVTPVHIPWSYGKDRVTAAAIDPHRLYVYWEVTGEAAASARAALGPAGADAYLCLRVYDTTGLLFDGTNAHHHFDHGIDPSERQWFFDIRRPTSTVFVEVGVRAQDGAFARIARSGRVDFPCSEPAPWADPEWMTVVAATGEAHPAGRGLSLAAPPGSGAPARLENVAPAEDRRPFTPIPLWVIRDPVTGREAWVRELTEGGWERVAWERVEWKEVSGEQWVELLGRVEWEGPASATSWEAGPFTYPVEVHQPTREEWQGHSVVYRIGDLTRVVHGPWQVVIRNLGAHASRSVLGSWQIYRSWVTGGAREARAGADRPAPPPPGASEGLAQGASERAWAFGSELRLGGASEVWRLGASELRLLGASELVVRGASEWLVRGGSEQALRGASEWLVRGGSEKVLRGASEQLLAGASERRLGGASEQRLGGASQRLLGGASEQRPGEKDGRGAETGAPPAATSGYPKAR